jgi:propanol-preferring alcohol dehydrogenase
MKAMVLHALAELNKASAPLQISEVPIPDPTAGEVLIRVTRCAVCHTELDEIEGRTAPARLPIILGHQAVGVVEDTGKRVGVAWIAWACGTCEYCRSGQENLCREFHATGRDVDGGYAEYMKARAEFVHPIPEGLTDSEAAPLLCAGAVGYRSLKLSNLREGGALGLMGFGGSNHLVLKMARYQYPGTPVFVFSRNEEEREFALALGAAWAGGIEEAPGEEMDAIIDTTPVWKPDMEALKRLKPGGRLVINAIRKQESDKEVLLKLDYGSQLWMEKEIKSTANVTRQDVREFLKLAAQSGIRPEFQEFELEQANQALRELKQGKIRGAKVLRIGKPA